MSRQDLQQEIYGLITALVGQANILTIPRLFIDLTGSLETALVLSQLVYWTGKSDKDGWVYKTYFQWYLEIGLNEYQIRKAKNKLEELGILETRIKKANNNPTVHYRVDSLKFTETILEFLKNRNLKNERNESLKIADSITTKITSEITSETTTPPTPSCDDALELLVSVGVNRRVAKKLEASLERVQQVVECARARNDIKDKPAWVVKAIQEQWLLPVKIEPFVPCNLCQEGMIFVEERNAWRDCECLISYKAKKKEFKKAL